MQFATMTEFLAMGGYGLYVWLGFGLGLLSVALLWFESWWVKKRLLSQVLIICRFGYCSSSGRSHWFNAVCINSKH